MDQRSRKSRPQRSAAYRKRAPVDAAFPSQTPNSGTESTPELDRQRIEQQVQLGIDSLRGGRVRDAEQYLLRAVQSDPGHALANNCLGILYRSLGRNADAIAHYRRALQTNPNYAEAHNNLGIAYEAKHECELAVASYRAALHCNAHFAAAHNNLGNALTKQGKFESAIRSFDEAIRLQPKFAAALNNRGLAMRDLQRDYDAEVSFREAIKLQPRFAEAYLNLGNVLRQRKTFESAIECFRLAIQIKPNAPEAHCGLGSACLEARRFSDARQAFQEAVRLAPGNADAWFGLGQTFRELGEYDASAASYRKATEVRPHFAEAHNNLANALASQGNVNGAIEVLEDALRITPDHLPVLNNLGNLYRLQDRLEEAADSYRQVLQRRAPQPLDCLRLSTLCPTVFDSTDALEDYAESTLAEWTQLRGAQRYATLQDLLMVANEPPYNLQFLPMNIRPWKEAYARIFDYAGPNYDLRMHGTPYRIGFVVTSQHEVAFLRLIWDALKQLDRDVFELTIICTSAAARKFRHNIRQPDVRIMALPDHPNEIVRTIADAQFDVLHYFEICTDVLNYFLPFFRLAPVQCTSWGIQVTSGIPTLDYYLSNEFVEPPGGQQHYSEQLALAKTFLAYQTPIQLPQPAKPRAAFGFDAGQTVYLSAQHLGKFHPDFDSLLAGILRRDPRGIVALTSDRYGFGAQRLEARFRRSIPDVAARIRFMARQSLPDYVSLVAAADVLLDPPHFGGVNTTYDGLALNQPIVSWPSQFHRGRYTYGCYQKMQMLDCVADSADQYVEIATKLGTDRDYRQAICEKIKASKASIFMDTQSISEHDRLFRDFIKKARS